MTGKQPYLIGDKAAFDWNDKPVWCILESPVCSLDNEIMLEVDETGFVEIIRFYVSMYL